MRETTIDAACAAEGLGAAAFAFQYARFIAPKLLSTEILD
jgi:hypothetical protein